MKAFAGGKLEKDMFEFELVDAETGKAIQNVSIDDKGKIVFTPDFSNDYEGKEFTFIIREASSQNTGGDGNDGESNDLRDDVLYDEKELKVKVRVGSDSDGNLTFETDYDNDNPFEFTNVALFDLEVSKIVTGLRDDPDKEFSFTIAFVNTEYGFSNNMTWTKGDKNGTVTLDNNGQFTFTLKHGETINFNNLTYGMAYTITEEEAGSYNTKVKTTTADGEVTETAGVTVTGVIGCDVSVEYNNHQNPIPEELPDTGGTGTKWIQWLGVVLMLASLGVLLNSSRRRNSLV